MKNPTLHEIVDHLAEHYGMPKMALVAITKTPLHPAELRDTFAGQAMQGICASGPNIANEVIACEAYAIANAMLEARQK